MELIKTNESVTRSYDADGNATDRVDSINYEVRDNDGNAIGNAHVNNGDASFNINLYGFSSIEEGDARLRETLGID